MLTIWQNMLIKIVHFCVYIYEHKFNLCLILYHHHQSVLPKDRSYTASAGTYTAVLPKADLPLQTQEPRLQFYQGLNRCGSFPLLSASHSLFSIWIDLKRSEWSQGHQHGGEESGFGWTSPKFTTGVKYQFHQGFFTRSEVWKSPSPFTPPPSLSLQYSNKQQLRSCRLP